MTPGRISVAIDGSAWDHDTGFGRYVREMTAALAERPELHLRLVARPSASRVEGLPGGLRGVEFVHPEGLHAAAHAGRSVAAVGRAMRQWASIVADVIWFPSVTGFVPVLGHVPVVVGVHDTIGHRYPRETFGSATAALAWRLKTRVAVTQATRIVTVSSHAEARLREDLGMSPDQLRVVGEGVSAAFEPVPTAIARRRLGSLWSRLGGGDPSSSHLVVWHGAMTPHKNLTRLVEAFARSTSTPGVPDAALVLVGEPPRHATGVIEELTRLGRLKAPRRVILTGHVDDETLRDLLSVARVAVLPSIEEGYGLTAIEAAACGVPVVATRYSAIPEVLGDAALIVDPLDIDGLAGAITMLLRDEAAWAVLRARSVERARDLTWARAADQLAAVFREVARR